MSRKTIAKLAGFVGALGISAAMIAAASSATGAYFTDSVNGSVTGTTGKIDLVSGSAAVKFTNLMPGEDQTATVNFNTTWDSARSDVWMVFDTTSAKYTKFTGADDGLGGYGHFKVASPAGNFESWNLAFDEGDPNAAYCEVDEWGHGGQTTKPVPDFQYCGVPGAIQLFSNIAPNAEKSATVTFGITGLATLSQGATWADLPFKLVATQVGKAPGTPDVA